jgi:hypothetical protein
MVLLINKIQDLTMRVKTNFQTINGNLYLDNYLIDEYFNLVATNWQYLKTPEVRQPYLELQALILDKILLNIIVNRQKGNLYNSMMTYNASCTEEDLHYFYNISYGGDGEIEHLCTHTGWGNGTSDLDAKRVLYILATDGAGRKEYLEVGPKFEVKDYKDFSSAKKHFEEDAETSVYHDANHVFIHVLNTNTYYIAENRKTSNWYLLADTEGMKHYRRQVILWLDNEGFLGVKFR